MIVKHIRKRIFIFCFAILLLQVIIIGATSADSLRDIILSTVGEQTNVVRQELRSLGSPEEITRYAADKRTILRELNAIDRTEPYVNARTIGTLERDRFTVEKIVYESLPGILVPANVYVPRGITGRVPAVLITEGHSAGGKNGYHAMCQGFCAQGYVVMTFDPLGQGERGIYYDRSSGNEHVSAGLQAYSADFHLGAVYIGDGISAIDYLLSRNDVDPARICVTGNSGGGAQSLVLGAIDKRIAVTIPSCYTTLDSMVVAITATHPETNYFGAFKRGVTMESLCAMIAPRPLLLNASKEDFFPIEGTRAVYETARKVYEAAGVPEKAVLFEGEGGHAYTAQKREIAYRFLAEHFGTEPQPEPDIDPIPERLLNCSETGNIEDDGSLTFFDLVRNRAVELGNGRAERLSESSRDDIRSMLANVLGIKETGHTPTPGIVSDDNTNATRHIVFEYTASDGFTLSAELYLTAGKESPDALTVIATPLAEFSSYQIAFPWLEDSAVLFVRPRGSAFAHYDKEGLFKLGITNRDYYFAVGALNAGTTVVGIQTMDIVETVRAVSALIPAEHVRLIGDDLFAIPVTCAAPFVNNVDELVLQHALWGYEAIASNRTYEYYLHPEVLMIRGLLRHFDLPELALASGCRYVSWESPVDHNRAPLYGDGIDTFSKRIENLALLFDMTGKTKITPAKE